MMDYPNLEKPNNAIFQFTESGGTFPGSFQQIKGSYDDYFHPNLIYKSQNVSKYLFGLVESCQTGKPATKSAHTVLV